MLGCTVQKLEGKLKVLAVAGDAHDMYDITSVHMSPNGTSMALVVGEHLLLRLLLMAEKYGFGEEPPGLVKVLHTSKAKFDAEHPEF